MLGAETLQLSTTPAVDRWGEGPMHGVYDPALVAASWVAAALASQTALQLSGQVTISRGELQSPLTAMRGAVGLLNGPL